MSSDASPQQAALAGAANEDAAIVLSQESMDALALFELLLWNGPGLNRRHADKLNSMGYDDDCIIAIVRIILKLRNHTATLLHCTQVPLGSIIVPAWDNSFTVGPEGLIHEGRVTMAVQHDDVLLPTWKNFADALSCALDLSGIDLGFQCTGLQMDNAVMGMLLKAFQTAPLKKLDLSHNDLGRAGMEFLANALETATTIEEVFISDNTIESEAAVSLFARAVVEHPRLGCLFISNCGIGQNDAVMAAMVPVLNSNNLRIICMDGNGIGLHGARLISACLSDNPAVESLDLDGNQLNDDAAKMIACSLQTNKNLRELRLYENPITDCGILALTKAVCDTSSLNAAHHSNHTCSIIVGKDGFLERFNINTDPDANRKIKFLAMICPSEFLDSEMICPSAEMLCPPGRSTPNIVLLKGIQIEVMPRVLATVNVLQHPLEVMFRLISEWGIPLMLSGGQKKTEMAQQTMRK